MIGKIAHLMRVGDSACHHLARGTADDQFRRRQLIRHPPSPLGQGSLQAPQWKMMARSRKANAHISGHASPMDKHMWTHLAVFIQRELYRYVQYTHEGGH